MESSATGSSSWTTRSDSIFGRIAMENPESGLSLRNFGACRGARGATNSKDPHRGSSRKALTNYVQDTDVADFVLSLAIPTPTIAVLLHRFRKRGNYWRICLPYRHSDIAIFREALKFSEGQSG
jgi:hypothetical protein